jgi:hypothetical protein
MSAVYPLFIKEFVPRSIAPTCVVALVSPWLAKVELRQVRATIGSPDIHQRSKGGLP